MYVLHVILNSST